MTLTAGAKFRYVNLGTGTITRHACPPGRCGDRYSLHRYWVYMDRPDIQRCRLVWLWLTDEVRS